MNLNSRATMSWAMMVPVIVFGLLLSATAQALSFEQKLHGFVREIEKTITLPQGAHKLENYDRYYADGAGKDAGRVIAVFRYHPAGRGKVFFVPYPSLPSVFDGGCNVIHLSYSMLEHRVESIACNGEG